MIGPGTSYGVEVDPLTIGERAAARHVAFRHNGAAVDNLLGVALWAFRLRAKDTSAYASDRDEANKQ